VGVSFLSVGGDRLGLGGATLVGLLGGSGGGSDGMGGSFLLVAMLGGRLG
jgi:hypothetical protein